MIWEKAQAYKPEIEYKLKTKNEQRKEIRGFLYSDVPFCWHCSAKQDIDRIMQNRSTHNRDGISGRKKVQLALFTTRVWIQIHSPLRPVSCSVFQCIQARDAQNDVDLRRRRRSDAKLLCLVNILAQRSAKPLRDLTKLTNSC